MEHGGFVIRRNFARINFPAIWPRLGSKLLLLETTTTTWQLRVCALDLYHLKDKFLCV